jgi:hypothetical protein
MDFILKKKRFLTNLANDPNDTRVDFEKNYDNHAV